MVEERHVDPEKSLRSCDIAIGEQRCAGRRRLASAGLVSLAVLLTGCSALSHGVFAAAGPVAEHERHIFWIVAAVLVFVATPVLLLVPLFAWHYRLSNTRHAYRPSWNFSWPVEGLIWIPPTAIVIGLGILVWRATIAEDPYRPLPGGPPIEVQAIALDWKWVFVYPGQGVASVDRLVIPTGRPVRLRLTSGTVMQSLLIPQLAGQVYAMAGMTTERNLAATKPGTYLGKNTQYNGDGFPRQRFAVVAVAAADYARWLGAARQAPPLDAAAWRSIAARRVEPRPRTFSHAAPDLFARVLAASGDPMR